MSVYAALGRTATGAQAQTLAMTGPPQRLRLMMLHSFRTSAAIFKQQMRMSGLDAQLKDLVELIYIDAPHEASGPIPADVQPYFDPPYREWWNFVKKDGDGAMQYIGFSESVAYVESQLREHAPIHGLCGFSQGAAIAALLTSYQRQGELLQSVDMMKFCLLFAGVISRLEEHRPAYTEPIACPSLHIIGDRDPISRVADRLAGCFQDPEIIRHPRGHVIASLPADDVKRMRDFLELVRVSVAQPSL